MNKLFKTKKSHWGIFTATWNNINGTVIWTECDTSFKKVYDKMMKTIKDSAAYDDTITDSYVTFKREYWSKTETLEYKIIVERTFIDEWTDIFLQRPLKSSEYLTSVKKRPVPFL
ncbi:MAG: hypothetical protein J6A00_06460 [Bacteroides sp.]|nr:hypothetical protein [Bacteroides sp.]